MVIFRDHLTEETKRTLITVAIFALFACTAFIIMWSYLE